MRKSVQNIRGVQDIQTNAGKVDMVAVPYRSYMRIAALEMEKSRRLTERESAMHRVQNIDVKVKEIEHEQAYLLTALRNHNVDENINPIKTENKFNQNKINKKLKNEGFKLKY